MNFETKLTGALSRFVIKFHKWIPLGALILAVLCMMAASNIKMKTETKDMLPADNPKIKSYMEIDDVFSGGSTAIITFEWLDETREPDKKRMIECAENFVKKTRNNEELMKYIRAINLKMDKKFIKKWALMLAKAKDIKQSKDTFSELNLLPFITNLNDSFEKTYTGGEAEEDINTRKQETEAVGMLKQVESFFVLLNKYIDDPASKPAVVGNTLAETFVYGESYNFNFDNTMLMFTISPNFDMYDINSTMAMMAEVKAIRKELQQNYPDINIGYTGGVPIGAGKMDAMGFDLMVPALVALFVILLLFIFSFTQIRAIVFVIITLIFGVIFAFGFLGVTIGEVNIMTSMMAVMLLGLGVDYGIQFVSNFNLFREDGMNRDEALMNTFQKAGMGIILAAVTTAIGFFVLGITGMKSFAQFGLVMGMGIIACLIAMIILLPALIYWWGRREFKKTRIPKINFDFLASLGKVMNKNSKTTIIISIIVTAGLLAAAIFLNGFRVDLMSQLPQDMPSVVEYKKVMDKYNMNPFASMVVANSVEEARDLTEKLEKEKLVASVNSISYLLPPADEQAGRLREIAKIRNMGKRYEADYTYDNRIKEFIKQLDRLEDNVIEIGQLSVAGLGEDNLITRKRNSMIHEVFGAEVGKPGKEVFQNLIKVIKKDRRRAARKLAAVDGIFAKKMDSIVSSMASVKRRMRITDLPKDYIDNFFNKDKTKNLVTIYPEKSVIDKISNMEKFNKKADKISPRITGMTQIMVEYMKEVTKATPKAGIYIFIAVLIFIIITFRSLRYTIAAIIPLVAGMVWMLGFYPLFGFKFDMSSFLLIPLIIGMGIDYGIHLAHRHKTEGNIENTYRFTGKGVFLSAATTMIGFGSLALIGKFPAIANMGAVLFFGIASCLLTSFIILPALLGFMKKEN